MTDQTSIAREYLEKAVPSHDFKKLRDLFHPRYSYTGSDGQRQEGPEYGVEQVKTFITAFPDLHLEIKHLYVVNNIQVVEFVASGTHQGDLMGIAPTGRKMTMPVCMVMEIRDGKIFSEREYMDMGHLMRQLGISPEQG